MAHSKHRRANIIFALFIGISVVLSIVFATYSGGLPSFGLGLFALCLVIVWGIQTMIDRKVDRQPTRQLTPAEMQRFNAMRIVVGLALVALLLFAITS